MQGSQDLLGRLQGLGAGCGQRGAIAIAKEAVRLDTQQESSASLEATPRARPGAPQWEFVALDQEALDHQGQAMTRPRIISAVSATWYWAVLAS